MKSGRIVKSVPVHYAGCSCPTAEGCWHWSKKGGTVRLHEGGGTSYLPLPGIHLGSRRYSGQPKPLRRTPAELRRLLAKSIGGGDRVDRHQSKIVGMDAGSGWVHKVASQHRCLLQKGPRPFKGSSAWALVPDGPDVAEAALYPPFWLAAKQAETCSWEEGRRMSVSLSDPRIVATGRQRGDWSQCVLAFKSGLVEVRAADDVGVAEIGCDADYDGPAATFGIHFPYLLEALGVWPVRLRWDRREEVPIIHFRYGFEWSLLVMGMRA